MYCVRCYPAIKGRRAAQMGCAQRRVVTRCEDFSRRRGGKVGEGRARGFEFARLSQDTLSSLFPIPCLVKYCHTTVTVHCTDSMLLYYWCSNPSTILNLYYYWCSVTAVLSHAPIRFGPCMGRHRLTPSSVLRDKVSVYVRAQLSHEVVVGRF